MTTHPSKCIRGTIPFTALCILAILAPARAIEDVSSRDPFWPVEYNAPKPEKTPDGTVISTVTAVTWPDLPVKGISRGREGEYLALVEGIGIVRAGEDISIQKENLWFHWRVSSITATGLRSIKLGATRDRTPPPYNPPSEKVP
jgi:hypothetical protein